VKRRQKCAKVVIFSESGIFSTSTAPPPECPESGRTSAEERRRPARRAHGDHSHLGVADAPSQLMCGWKRRRSFGLNPGVRLRPRMEIEHQYRVARVPRGVAEAGAVAALLAVADLIAAPATAR
jgi:hypothetical protein